MSPTFSTHRKTQSSHHWPLIRTLSQPEFVPSTIESQRKIEAAAVGIEIQARIPIVPTLAAQLSHNLMQLIALEMANFSICPGSLLKTHARIRKFKKTGAYNILFVTWPENKATHRPENILRWKVREAEFAIEKKRVFAKRVGRHIYSHSRVDIEHDLPQIKADIFNLLSVQPNELFIQSDNDRTKLSFWIQSNQSGRYYSVTVKTLSPHRRANQKLVQTAKIKQLLEVEYDGIHEDFQEVETDRKKVLKEICREVGQISDKARGFLQKLGCAIKSTKK